MKKISTCICLILTLCVSSKLKSQITAPKFGKGLHIMAADSSFYMKIGFRFQTLMNSDWTLGNDDFSSLQDNELSYMIRRSRLKFDGYALTPKLKYKAELSLSNRDNGGGNSPRYSNAANIILDAFITYNFYKGVSIWAGQGKMPGNRERIISSGDLQFVDRSRLNSRFTLDRDVGLMLINQHKFGSNFNLVEKFAVTTGEGKNITAPNVGGLAYTFKVEAFPFGNFKSKGAYVGADNVREPAPKLAIAAAYDINKNAGRERGRTGDFIVDDLGNPGGKDLNSFFADLMFKYRGWSAMIEYANFKGENDSPFVYDQNDELIGTYYTGNATNICFGYVTNSNWEIALRYTDVNPSEGVASPENQYTVCLSKYIVGHKLKVQTDITYREVDLSDDNLIYRMQMDIHF